MTGYELVIPDEPAQVVPCSESRELKNNITAIIGRHVFSQTSPLRPHSRFRQQSRRGTNSS